MRVIAIVWLAAALFPSCGGAAPDPRTDDTPTRGDVLILAEEDFRALLESAELAFENIYRDADVRLRFLPQAELMRAMLVDSVRAVFTTCLPGGEQEAYFRSRSLSPDIVPILTDGIAVVAAENGRHEIALDSLVERIARLGGVVFDGARTGVARTIADSLFGGEAGRIARASAVAGPDSLAARVAADARLLGLISFARISDLDDARCRALRKGLVLCGVSGHGAPVVPNQSTLADGSYPLRRTLYAVVTEGRSGLGTGFVSFVAGHKGQRIVLKSGLAPKRVPEREVMLVN